MSLKKVIKKVEEVFNISLYKSQINAIKALNKGYSIELPTGEGKSFVLLSHLLAVIPSKESIFVVYPNDYLRTRDFTQFCKVAGADAVLINKEMGSDELIELCEVYKVKFISAETLMFHIMRLFLAGKLDAIKLDYCLIDEMDLILLDNINVDFSISEKSMETTLPVALLDYISNLEKCLNIKRRYSVNVEDAEKVSKIEEENPEVDVFIVETTSSVEFTTNGRLKIEELGLHEKDVNTIGLLQSFIYSKHVIEKDIDYAVVNDEIILLNKINGRFSQNSKLGYEQTNSLEYIHGLPLTANSIAHFSFSYCVLFNMFNNVSGCSATTYSVKHQLKYLYKVVVKKIKSNFKSNKSVTTLYAQTELRKFANIAQTINEHKSDSNIVFFDSEKSLNNFVTSFPNFKADVLINRTISEENSMIEKAAEKGNVLLTTRLAGRGTDITPKGCQLVVHISGITPTTRDSLQFYGRTDRQGRGGMVYLHVADSDYFFKGLTHEDISKFKLESLTSKDVERLCTKLHTRNQQRMNVLFQSRLVMQSFAFFSYIELYKVFRTRPDFGKLLTVYADWLHQHLSITGPFLAKEDVYFKMTSFISNIQDDFIAEHLKDEYSEVCATCGLRLNCTGLTACTGLSANGILTRIS